MAERIPDEVLVVRGGRNQPADLERGMARHPSGVTGVSVEHHATLTGLRPAEARRLLTPTVVNPTRKP